MLIRHVGPEEAELRAQWADATGLAWYAETAVARVEAQAIADRLWLELVALTLKAGDCRPGQQPTEMRKE